MKLKIIQDEDPSSPLEWDNLGTMVCWHRRYKLGDKHDHRDPQAFQEWLAEQSIRNLAVVVLPLYLYDHSGITMSTKPFSCPWDSGQVGFIYADEAKIRNEFSLVNPSAEIHQDVLDRVKAILEQEVKTYDQFLKGDVWGYVIEDDEGNHLDSMWGMFGREYCEEEGKAALAHAEKHSFDPVI